MHSDLTRTDSPAQDLYELIASWGLRTIVVKQAACTWIARCDTATGSYTATGPTRYAVIVDLLFQLGAELDDGS